MQKMHTIYLYYITPSGRSQYGAIDFYISVWYNGTIYWFLVVSINKMLEEG